MHDPHVFIRLEMGAGSALDWKEALQEARQQISSGKKILWDLDLGFGTFALEDELCFKAATAALGQFSKTVFADFGNHTLGAILYRGSLDLPFVWSERQKQNWENGEGPKNRRLFCADSYAAYFRMLAHPLPDELALYLLFDGQGIARSEALQLLSKQRYEHFELATRNVGALHWALEWQDTVRSPLGARLGVCFPEDKACTEEALKDFEALLSQCQAIERCRVVGEAFLTEQWDGLDAIAVLSKHLSARGKRQLMGFCAAGGLVVTEGALLGLCNEVGLDEIRGRGI